MPIYDYKCTVCGNVHEEMRSVSDRNEDAACPECFNIALKTVTAPAGINGGFHEGYRHKSGTTGVWKTDVGPQGKVGKEWYGDNPHATSTLDTKIK
jgi:putative FmdB family regulatory protein